MTKLYAKRLLNVLGSFWGRLFGNGALLRQLVRGQLVTHEQSEQNVSDLVKSVGNQEIPAGRTTSWTKFVFSYYNQTKIEHGDPNKKYGPYPIIYSYGQLNTDVIAYDLPEELLSIPFLYDDIAQPTKVLTENIDYKIEDNKLYFRTPIRLDGKETVFYARNVVKEAGFTTSRLGYALGVALSDEVYSVVPFKHLWRLGSYGPNYLDMLTMLGACANSPVTQNDEQVELVYANGPTTVVVTDKAGYVVPTAKINALKVGQAIPQGTSLTSSLQIIHDKDVYVTEAIPAPYRDRKTFKYGKELAIASSMVIIKADIQGPAAAALKVFRQTLPVDVKVLIFTNINIAEPILAGTAFGFDCKASYSVITPALAINESQVSVKATSRVKYSTYGY